MFNFWELCFTFDFFSTFDNSTFKLSTFDNSTLDCTSNAWPLPLDLLLFDLWWFNLLLFDRFPLCSSLEFRGESARQLLSQFERFRRKKWAFLNPEKGRKRKKMNIDKILFLTSADCLENWPAAQLDASLFL